MAHVQLSDDLVAQLEAIVKDSAEFSSVDEYVQYVMQQVVVKKQQAQTPSDQPAATYSKDDEDKIRERLKNLGYLD